MRSGSCPDVLMGSGSLDPSLGFHGMSDDAPEVTTENTYPLFAWRCLGRLDNGFKGIVEINRLLAKMCFSVVFWAKPNDIGNCVGTIVPKADDVMGFDVSVTIFHEKALFTAILTTSLGPAKNVVADHTISLVGKPFHSQPFRQKRALGNIIKVIERRLAI